MQKYKLKKDFLNLKAGTVVDIFKKIDEWTISITKYVISIKDWVIAEIVDSTHFVFEEYFEEEKEEKSIFELQEWDKYYIINCDWNIGLCDYDWWNLDRKFIKTWNIFLTKEEAEKELARRQAIQRIKKYCYENNIEYKENVSNNDFPFYIIKNKKKWFEPSSWHVNDSYTWFLFFDNYKDINKIIENRLDDLKIIFEVG